MADERTPANTEAEVNAARLRAFNALADFLESLTRLAGKLETMADQELAERKGGRG